MGEKQNMSMKSGIDKNRIKIYNHMIYNYILKNIDTIKMKQTA